MSGTDRKPVVFLSSTSEDLKECRAAAIGAVQSMGFDPLAMEYFTASGDKPPLHKCLELVSRADVVVVIVAHRYGWAPPDQRPGEDKSVTWLECERAAEDGTEVVAFLADKDAQWPVERKESYRISAAIEKGEATPELFAEVNRSTARLAEFKRWLDGRAVRKTFKNCDELGGLVAAALHAWCLRHPDKCNLGRKRPGDPYKYLLWLREQTATIDIRGLQVGSDKAHNFPIRDLYIPLTTAAGAGHLEEGDDERGLHPETERRVVDLDTALRHRWLVIVGDPGAGKTTFLRRLAFELAEGRLKAPQAAAGDPEAEGERTMLAWFREAAARPPFPVFIRIDGFARHIRAGNNGPADRTAPRWIPHYLAARAHDLNWDLDEDFFRDRLASGEAMVLLDGLDEAPEQAAREDMARLLEQATRAWADCPFIVTTRPAEHSGLSTLRDFEHAWIEPLQPEAIHQFLQHWWRCLYPDSPGEAKRHLKELEAALRMSTAIRGMASNPVMLTALAVLHWNDRRLPQQRAESWERFLLLLQHLALAMQSGGGRKVQMSKGAAVDILAGRFTELPRDQQRQRALDFLTQEEADSGIIVSRDTDVRFWHLTFQEHLAARAIAGLAEGDQAALLLDGGQIYQQEWREVALLLAGVLRVKQGPDKVDVLVKAVLDHLGSSAPLAERARCVGLIGAIVRDLRPFHYQPADPRYSEALASVVEIFDSEKANEMEFRIRLEAAKALGQAGDPRLEHENWVRIGNFEIGRYPVTVQEYRRFAEAGDTRTRPIGARVDSE
jgi:hypothetical protein